MAISDAVGIDRVSRVVGYKITKGNFNNSSSNLPQRIAVLAEANTANQTGLSLDPIEITTLQQAATLYGFGSPIYTIMRILRPSNGGGVGGVPVVVYPLAEEGGATSKIIDVTPSGTANGNATHTLLINGRESIEGQRFDFVVAKGDSVALIVAKINDTVNAVLGSAMASVDATTKATLTSKWKGISADNINVEILTNDKAVGITYAVAEASAGAGLPPVTTALNSFNSDWNTIVINSQDEAQNTVLDELEVYNGIPDPTTPTGRYNALIVKPFIALTGSVIATGLDALMTARKLEVTNTFCPAPTSKGLPMEAAANMAVLFSTQANTTPHLDVSAKYYPDMPIASSWNLSDMKTYDQRDSLVKKGVTTVDFVQNRFQVQDFVTSYHPDGEVVPQYRYCRNIMLDLNVFFGYHLLEEINVIDHAIASDLDVVSAVNVIKPKQWKSIIRAYAEDLGKRALIADVQFFQNSITVGLSSTNPDRLETFFKYKRSGVARISSTTAEAGFNFGEI